ncbi:PEP-CTERM sorting domain-containing protein [Cellvibrio sp. NN19]|uniref:PEP-CTERM sorting domain-containing protein n=1 Tax=Cellvibrio chitinivorans TaxID=3102792 RepID=UPI002B407A8F|nr:PEP-CTERM sorting domain-containing protein [Cellvibrio sp. NN19]
MIKSLKVLFAAALCALSLNSFAGMIVDVERDGVETKLNTFQSISWVHDINEWGFTPGSALSASISIDIKDDANDPFWFPFELALVKLGNFDFQDGGVEFDATETWVGNLGFSSLAKLNLDGTLAVTVTSLAGDFIVGKSTLTVNVPESSTLMLFGLGLLGLGVMRRKVRA